MLLLLQSLLDSAGVPISDSLRVDTAELISGAYVIGDVGLGVLGSAVPSTGQHGPSYLYNDLVMPDDAGKEIRGLIVTAPSAGTFFAFEDGSFTLTGAPDGTYTFTYRLFVDGVDLGTATATITIGGPSDLDLILKILRNRQELNASTGTFTIYDNDSVTVLYTANAWADAAGTIPYSGGTLARIDALV